MTVFQHEGRSIGHQTTGDGPAILAFHGTTQSANAWDGVIQLCQEPRTWVVVEFPGSGESPLGDGPLELDRIVADAVALMASLGHERFHVVGYSLGAVAALRCAALHTEAVLSVTSLCGWSRADARMRVTFDLWRKLIEISPELFMHYAIADGYTVGAIEAIEPMIDQVLPLAGTAVQPGSVAHLELDSRVDLEDCLESITAPTLVMGATWDRWVDVSHSHHLAARIKNATLVELPAGHLAITECANEIAERIVAHTR